MLWWCMVNCWVWFLSLSQLLGDMLLDRSNSAVMTQYVSSRENLRILMNLLRVWSFYIKLNYMPNHLPSCLDCVLPPYSLFLCVWSIPFLYRLLFLVSKSVFFSPKFIECHHYCYSCSLSETLSINIWNTKHILI